ncbi:hypothetical protein AXI59_17890 [Bacillus nakamurai]|uniref:metallophosphoesterase n=1 Tax=Bacillus nakamurai TaxID=1793963 RepID=UPI0007782A71|nr:metallophosphoesterase [Bacillus nakamurai]KXZ17306.1 hypothetical protein AXI59_17890 [Bacillus nakamurai]
MKCVMTLFFLIGLLCVSPSADAAHKESVIPVIQQEFGQPPHYIPLLESPPQIEVKAEMKRNLFIQAHVRDAEYKAFSAFLFYKQSNELGFKMVPMEPAPGAIQTFMVQISKREIWNGELEYYIVFSNGKQRAESETKRLKLDGYQADLAHIPELMITELAVDTKNDGGGDAYEFIEVYNTTDRPIHFKDYQIRYRYPKEGPESDLMWRPAKDAVIPSGGAYVFWLRRASSELTAEDFNGYYGTHLKEGENLAVIEETEGMANSRPRAVVLSTNTGKDIAIAHYRKHAFRRLSSLLYKYPLNGTEDLLAISTSEQKPSPGFVFQAQVPQQKRPTKPDKEKPVIEDLTNRKPVRPTESIELKADIRDKSLVKTAAFYYRTNEKKPFKRILAEKDRNDNLYHHIIYSPELIGQDQLEYYIAAGDGENEAKTPVKMIDIEQTSKSHGLRMNIDPNDTISGTQLLKATSDISADKIKLWIDGKLQQTRPALEKEVYFAFDTRKTNLYFQNAVMMENKVIKIFDDPTHRYRTYSVLLPERLLQKGGKTPRVTIRSGSKVSPYDTGENRDDFLVKNARLVLSDGTVIRDGEQAPGKQLFIGDNQRANQSISFRFSLPDHLFTSRLLEWNTAKLSEGYHHIFVSDGEEQVSMSVRVDNTGPEIDPGITDGQKVKGNLVLQAKIRDTWSKVEEVKAFLDGESITLPYHTSSAELEPGKHTLKISAADLAGNETTAVRTFSTEREQPNQPELIGQKVSGHKAKLSVRVKDPTKDAMDLSFYRGFRYTARNPGSVKVYKHASVTEPPKGMKENETPFTLPEMNQITANDGKTVTTESMERFPYHRFEVTVDPSVDETDQAEAVWKGSSLPGRKVTMYIWNYRTSCWQEADSFLAKNKKPFTLKASVSAADVVKHSKMNVIVQDEIPAKGDYTFVWMSDTQYYAKSHPHIFDKMTEWLKENKEKHNIKYVFHTGDIVDDSTDMKQWKNADRSMRTLDKAGIPYGVLAGNHDVGHKDGTYRTFGDYFGSRRFDQKLHYGESYKNNRGHYDLVSSSGNDFIMIYMGWGITDQDIDWINKVLKQYPDRTAILCFHEYLLVSGNRSPIGETIYKKVVKPNRNVMMVLSGHYHNAMRKTDALDDDGDGKPDRLVHQILTDYQDGPEGGQGYMRLMQFDQAANQVHMFSYSPYTDDINYYDTDLFGDKDDFSAGMDLEPKMKKVATDYFECNIYTNELLGHKKHVKSGKTAHWVWNNLQADSVYYWYTVVKDPFNGKTKSPIWMLKTGNPPYHPAPDQLDFRHVSNP